MFERNLIHNSDSVQHSYRECPPTLLARLKQRLGYSDDEARKAWTELLRFLIVCGQADGSLAPSKRIDEVWHEVILHTRDYAALCTALCGHFIHHTPTAEPDPEAYTRTLALLTRAFGPLNDVYWPRRHLALAKCCSGCGSSCSD
jgi:hypothetical protein